MRRPLNHATELEERRRAAARLQPTETKPTRNNTQTSPRNMLTPDSVLHLLNRTSPRRQPLPAGRRCKDVALMSVMFALAFSGAQAMAATNVTYKAALTLKETYDDNVFILDTKPYPGLVSDVCHQFDTVARAVVSRVLRLYSEHFLCT